ncbi:MAG: hypothetical protein LC100_08490 [Chitinophagales bacterium]|nr:hypothetical protein [Chitinophagales bacterium]
MGYTTKENITGHGFRATARTILDERLGFDRAAIEAQLAHSVKDLNGRAYNRTEFVQQRRTMLQAWANYLDWTPCARAMCCHCGHTAARPGHSPLPEPPPAALRGGFFVPARQRSVRFLQRNATPAVFPQNRGNVGTNKVKRLETLI